MANKTERELSAEDVREIAGRLKVFLEPFQELLTREEQRVHAEAYIEGRSRQLTRRTSEPIDRGNKRRPLQHFVGAGTKCVAGLERNLAARTATPFHPPEIFERTVDKR